MGIDTGNRSIARSPEDVAFGPPYLHVYVLVDECPISLHSFFQMSVDLLDEATGDRVHVDMIGNPQLSGPCYQGLRTSALERQDEADAQIYQQRLNELGGDPDAGSVYRSREAKKLARKLNLNVDQMPCVAFCTYPELIPPVTLRLKREWFDTDRSKRVFIETFSNWFRERRYERAIPPGASVGFVRNRLEKLLPALSKEIVREIKRVERAAVDAMIPHRQKKPFYVVLRLEELTEGKIWENRCARLVGHGRLDMLNKEIGVRQLLYVWVLLKSGREEEIDGRLCQIVAEKTGTGELVKWCDAGYLLLRGDDTNRPASRFRKGWGQFVGQMRGDSNMKDLFFSRKDNGRSGERLYGIRLARDECQIHLPDIQSLLGSIRREDLII